MNDIEVFHYDYKQQPTILAGNYVFKFNKINKIACVKYVQS